MRTRSIINCKPTISNGIVIFALAVSNSTATVGIGCTVYTATTGDHDSVIKDFVHIRSGVHLGGSVFARKEY